MNNYLKRDIQEIVEDRNVHWENFRNTSVLITGATGMLPSYMLWTFIYLNEYQNYGITIYAVVRDKERANKVLGEYSGIDYLRLIVQDVSKPLQIEAPIHYIIHAASQASPKYYSSDPIGTINANILGTINTLNLACNQKDFRGYLYFSSADIYGIVSPEHIPFAETDYGYIDLLNIRSCYCESKRMGEQLCVAYHHQYGLPTHIIRIFHTYGPYMRLDDRRAFADFVKNIVNNEDIVLLTNGSTQRTFCYVTDAIRAYFLVLLCGEEGSAYNVANTNEFVSIRQLAETLVSLFPKKGLKVRYELDPSDIVTNEMNNPVKVAIPDCRRINLLGWDARISIAEGFRRTIENIEESLKGK